jgi:hypothetical protein
MLPPEIAHAVTHAFAWNITNHALNLPRSKMLQNFPHQITPQSINALHVRPHKSREAAP